MLLQLLLFNSEEKEIKLIIKKAVILEKGGNCQFCYLTD